MIEAAAERTTKLDDDFYRDIVRHTADAIVAIDADQKIVFANPAMEQMFGYAAEELLGQDLNILLPDRFRKDHVAQVHNFLSSGEDARYMGKRLTQIIGCRADGEEIRLSASIVRARSGGKAIFAAFLRDISWRMEMVEKLSDMARLDPLTGQLNRRAFLDGAAEERARAERYNTGIAFLFMDLDDFKRLNDSYGHDAGDEVLRSFSSLVHERLRSVDTLCRWGGEEFIAMLTNVDRDGTIAAAERIRRGVETHAFVLPDGRSVHLSVSIGVSHASGSGIEISDQIKRADEALYKAKNRGRNRVEYLENAAGTSSRARAS